MLTLPFRIISTLGPASMSRDFLSACVTCGQPYFRLNGSHMSPDRLDAALAELREMLPGAPEGLTLDLQGGKARLGSLASPRALIEGREVRLAVEASESSSARSGDEARPLPVPHREIFLNARAGDCLLLQDGEAELEALDVGADSIRARVLRGATVRGGCGVHIRGRSLLSGELPAAQREQVRVARRHGVGSLALSYVQTAGDVDGLRGHCLASGYDPRVVAKVERPEAVDAIEAVSAAADEVWFCRGDLGSLVPLRELGGMQKLALDAARAGDRDIVIAGQVFHHLTEHAQPTRSEVVHLHSIRDQGAAGIVLSDETAIGNDPVGALQAVVELL